MTLYQSNAADVLRFVYSDHAIGNGKNFLKCLRGGLILDDTDDTDRDGRRPTTDDEVVICGLWSVVCGRGKVFRLKQLAKLNRTCGKIGIAIGWNIDRHSAVFRHHLSPGDDHLNGQRGQVAGDHDVGIAARRDAADVAFDSEMQRGVERSHLDGGNRPQALGDGMAHDAIHVPLANQRAGVGVVGAEDEVAAVEAHVGDGPDLRGHVVPGRAEAQHGLHALPHAGDGVFQPRALVIVGRAAGHIAVEGAAEVG